MIARRQAPLATLLAAAVTFRIGNAVSGLALPWLVLTLTDSAVWAGGTAASGVMATLLGAIIGGGAIDRWGPRLVAAVAGVLGGLATAAIPWLAAEDGLPGVWLVALVALGAAFDAPGMAAQESRLPELGRLAGWSVTRVSSAKGVLSNGAILVGPALGGAAIGFWGPATTLWLTAACSIAAGLLGALALPRRAARRPSDEAPPGVWAGAAHLRHEPLLGPLLGVVTLFSGIVSASGAVMVPALFQAAGRPAADFGVFMSALGAGGLVGAAVHGLWEGRIAPRVSLALGFAGYAGALLLLSQLPSVPALLAIGGVAGLMTGAVSPIFNRAIYTRTPLALRGRVLGAISAVAVSAAPVTAVVAGLAIDHNGPEAALIGAAPLAMILAGLSLRLEFSPRSAQGVGLTFGAMPDLVGRRPDERNP